MAFETDYYSKFLLPKTVLKKVQTGYLAWLLGAGSYFKLKDRRRGIGVNTLWTATKILSATHLTGFDDFELDVRTAPGRWVLRYRHRDSEAAAVLFHHLAMLAQGAEAAPKSLVDAQAALAKAMDVREQSRVRLADLEAELAQTEERVRGLFEKLDEEKVLARGKAHRERYVDWALPGKSPGASHDRRCTWNARTGLVRLRATHRKQAAYCRRGAGTPRGRR